MQNWVKSVRFLVCLAHNFCRCFFFFLVKFFWIFENDCLTVLLKWCTEDEWYRLKVRQERGVYSSFGYTCFDPCCSCKQVKTFASPSASLLILVILCGSHLRVNSRSRNQSRNPQTSTSYKRTVISLRCLLRVDCSWFVPLEFYSGTISLIEFRESPRVQFFGDAQSWRQPVAKSRLPVVCLLGISLKDKFSDWLQGIARGAKFLVTSNRKSSLFFFCLKYWICLITFCAFCFYESVWKE